MMEFLIYDAKVALALLVFYLFYRFSVSDFFDIDGSREIF